MKTREVSGYVQVVAIESFERGDFGDVPFFRNIPNRPAGDFVEAKIIFAAKEKKIEITESFYDSLIEALEGDLCLVNHKQLKQKLFGEGV